MTTLQVLDELNQVLKALGWNRGERRKYISTLKREARLEKRKMKRNY